MKRIVTIIICLTVLLGLIGCGAPTAEKPEETHTVRIANPWSSWSSVAEAEAAVGFSFGLPDVIAECYHAESFRTMNGELMEVVYRCGDFTVCVRKQKGEGQDISGDYNIYETCTETNCDSGRIITYRNSNNSAVKQIISYQGYSWSLVADYGYWEDSNETFIHEIWQT